MVIRYNVYMLITLPLQSITKNDTAIAGGKGASLGEMLNANIPVPNGFVVTTEAFTLFLDECKLAQEIDSVLHNVDHKIISTVEHAAQTIQALIMHANVPQTIADEILNQYQALQANDVAVRSSATAEDGSDHAWAGQLDSFLNTTEEMLLENVKRCWASLFTPRAIYYRFEKQLTGSHISVAVVVQAMVQSEKSGVAFSVHPITQEPNQLIIEAGLGLGEAIVAGAITPDAYVVSKQPANIIDTTINKQTKALYRAEGGGNVWQQLNEEQAQAAVLNKQEILELSSIVQTIENHYGFPCDIEWAYANGQFYITQSRPITTLHNI